MTASVLAFICHLPILPCDPNPFLAVVILDIWPLSIYNLGCRQKIEKIPPALFGMGLTQKTIWRLFFGRRVSSSLAPLAF